MGYSCETLGVYPFTPVNIQTIETTLRELLRTEEISDCPVVVLPGISTYVGGDIISGLFALEFDKRKEISVLIDLGTNGEMAIGNQERILVTSTAAGPAFEGGNIVCGTGSIPVPSAMLRWMQIGMWKQKRLAETSGRYLRNRSDRKHM